MEGKRKEMSFSLMGGERRSEGRGLILEKRYEGACVRSENVSREKHLEPNFQ